MILYDIGLNIIEIRNDTFVSTNNVIKCLILENACLFFFWVIITDNYYKPICKTCNYPLMAKHILTECRKYEPQRLSTV